MIYMLQCDARVPSGRFKDIRPCRTVRLFAGEPLPPPRSAAGFILLGGYMGVQDREEFPFLLPLQDFVATVARSGIPLLGICLGAQMLAAALGAQVTANTREEKGVHAVTLTTAGTSDPFFAGIPPSFPVFQWHNDSFAIPFGAVQLASSVHCPGQAFRYRQAYGVQFHPEVNVEIVNRWTAAHPEGERLRADYAAVEERCGQISEALLGNFLRLTAG